MAEDLNREKFCLILFSGDVDKAMAALTLANGAAGDGLETTVFFTFWGINLLREKTLNGLYPLENLFKRIMPRGVNRLGMSKLNFAGAGSRLLERLIRQKKGMTAGDLFQMAMERQVRFIACEASLKLLGIGREELINYQNLEIAGVDAFFRQAMQSKVTLFV